MTLLSRFPAFLGLAACGFCASAAAVPPDTLQGGKPGPEIIRPSSVVLLPVVSVFLPGFGQMAQRRYLSGAAFGAAGFGGLVLATHASYEGDGSLEDALFDHPGARRQLYGLGLYQGAGFMSAWDAFQASIPAQQQDKGRFRFLDAGQREKPADLLLAPFKPVYLKRPSTYIPLGVLAVLATLGVQGYRVDKGSEPGLRWRAYEPGDAFFTGAVSMNAGATEEAMFRGYLFPLFHQWSGERAWVSNPAQALLFAGAHIGGVSNVPVAQGLLGLYLGWLTQRDDWKIGQAVAIHFWWDVIALSAAMFTRHDVPVSLGSFSIPVDL
jgi:membrane protease YdiL (CAAX protease family)